VNKKLKEELLNTNNQVFLQFLNVRGEKMATELAV